MSDDEANASPAESGRIAGRATLALIAVLTAVGCTRTVVAQQPATSNATSATTNTSSTPAHSAVNDKAKLCNLFSSRGKEMLNAIDDLNRVIDHENWSWSEPKISESGDKVIDVARRTTPILEQSIGPDISSDLSDKLKANIKAFKNYADAIESRPASTEFKPVDTELDRAISDFNVACGFKSN